MVKRKIIWSHKANIKLFGILDYYSARNNSNTYSKKLYRKIIKESSVLLKQPEIGISTDHESIRGLIVDNFIIFYKNTPELIIIHTIWDCRQNPDSMNIK